MHPGEVAELVALEFGDLQRRLAERGDSRIHNVELRSPTQIAIEFAGRIYQSELIPQGLARPAEGGFVQPAIRVPILGAVQETRLLLLASCENWDGDPPEFDLRQPNGGELADWPKDPTGRGIVRGHPKYDRPFFCRPGTREYHSHPVHEDDPWDKYREAYTLDAMIASLLDDLLDRWTMT